MPTNGIIVPATLVFAGTFSHSDKLAAEFFFILSELKHSSLRRKWDFCPTARRLPEKRIRLIAQTGVIASCRRVSASTEKGCPSPLTVLS